MPKLTTPEFLAVVISLFILVGLTLLLMLRRSNRKQKKGGFEGYLVGRILVFKADEGLPDMPTHESAVNYVALAVERVKYDYAQRNGHFATDNLPALCARVVKDLCKFGIIPKEVHKAWR